MKKASIALLLTAFSSVSSIAFAEPTKPEPMKPGLWQITDRAYVTGGVDQGLATVSNTPQAVFGPTSQRVTAPYAHSKVCVTPEMAAKAVSRQPPFSAAMLQNCTMPKDGFDPYRIAVLPCMATGENNEKYYSPQNRVNVLVRFASSAKYVAWILSKDMGEMYPDDHHMQQHVLGRERTFEWLGPDCGKVQPRTK